MKHKKGCTPYNDADCPACNPPAYLGALNMKHAVATTLRYVGKQKWPGNPDMRLWNIIQPGSPWHQSTRSLEGLQELGIVPKA